MGIYEEKISFLRNIINNIQIAIIKYNKLSILSTNEYNNAYEILDKNINLLNSINYENIIDELQYINNNLSVFEKYLDGF